VHGVEQRPEAALGDGDFDLMRIAAVDLTRRDLALVAHWGDGSLRLPVPRRRLKLAPGRRARQGGTFFSLPALWLAFRKEIRRILSDARDWPPPPFPVEPARMYGGADLVLFFCDGLVS
jgi:hypothetical protein